MYLQNPAPLLRAPLEDKTPAPGKRSDAVKRPATPLEYLFELASGKTRKEHASSPENKLIFQAFFKTSNFAISSYL